MSSREITNYRRALWVLSLFGTLSFIFANTLTPAEVSGAQSGALYLTLWRIFPFLTHALVRKLAHLCEYALLGAHLFFLPLLFPRSRAAKPLMLGFGLLAALLDEGLQSLVPGRAPTFTDVLIDILGYFLGLLFILLFLFVRKRFKREGGSV